MRNLVCALLLTLTALTAAPAASAPAPAASTAEALVARHLEARGGLARIRAVQTLKLTGKIEIVAGGANIEAAFGQLYKQPGKGREEFTLQGLSAVDAWDGKQAWSLDPFQGRREAETASADDAKDRARESDWEGPLVGYAEKGHKVESLGSEDVDGTAAFKLRVSRADGDVQYVYLDPDTFLTIRVTTESKRRGVERITEADYGSYVLVEGVAIPLSVEAGPKGERRNARITFERAEVNGPVDDAVFKMPAAGVAIGRAIAPGAGPGAELKVPAAARAARAAAVLDKGVISGLGARNIGSAEMSGRVSAVAARNENGKTTVYIGAASGGVWKSLDGGTTFKPVFDKMPVQSIGAIAIDPSHPRTIWVGTGEAWTRNSVSIGDGIYKSTDGGESWVNVGLPKSERIVKIVVHPGNGDIVYACAPGKLWSDSPDRGLYKTTDGGKSWDLILTGGNLSTGCSGISLDPKNPDLLFAGLWDFRRKGWTFRSGGEGPDAPSGSGLYRSADGGKSWAQVTAKENKGFPAGPLGRVEVVIAPSDSKIVYALLESAHSALYRSSDGGATWEARDNSQMMVWRPFYFARLIVDPLNAERLFKPDGNLIVSEDGGRSFSRTNGGAHGDWHDLWIDPDNTRHVIGGDDGGFWLSSDGGNRWWKSQNLPISQFYHVAVDAKDPYQVYGGLQDNSSWAGDSAYPGGVTNSRWENLFGGDGFWTIPDPSDPDYVYAESQGGNIGRVNHKTLVGRIIQPTAGFKEKLRFNWNTPIHASPTEKGTIYIGGQFLFRSRDHGDNWERISPDLTTNDKEKQKQEESGGVTVDNSSAEMHTTIYSISESPLDAKLVWVGTDDGNVQLTRDAGKTWTNLTANLKGVPRASWVSWVEASRFQAGTALVAIDRHTYGDFTPWVYRTTDFGKSWTRICGPDSGVRGYAHVIKEDTVNPALLFLGTELGLWISIDNGASWAEFKGGDFPSVAVRDLQIHGREGDLVLATHGRGIWIVDDLAPLRALSHELLNKEVAFLPVRPVQQRFDTNGGWPEGDATFVGQNPVAGALITYYQRSRHLFGPIKLEILDASGKLVDSLTASKRRGINRVSWTMQTPPPRVPRAAQLAFAAARGPRVLPGVYTVRLTKGADVVETKLAVGLDARAPYSVAERKEQYEAVMRAHALFGEMSTLVERLDAARAATAARLQQAGGDATLAKKLRDTAGKLDDAKKKIVATKEGGAITGEQRLREYLDELYGALDGYEGKPAKYQLERLDVLQRELAEVQKQFDSLTANDLPSLDEQLRRRGLAPIPTAPGAAPERPTSATAMDVLGCLHGTATCGTRAATRAGERD